MASSWVPPPIWPSKTPATSPGVSSSGRLSFPLFPCSSASTFAPSPPVGILRKVPCARPTSRSAACATRSSRRHGISSPSTRRSASSRRSLVRARTPSAASSCSPSPASAAPRWPHSSSCWRSRCVVSTSSPSTPRLSSRRPVLA